MPAFVGIDRRDAHQPVHAAFRTQPAVGATAVDRDRHALEPRLLALLLVDDLGLESVPFRPAQVHAQEHLRPVGRLGAAGSGADRQDRGPGVVLAGEQQLRALAGELGVEGVGLALRLGFQLGVAGFGRQLDRRLEVGGACEESVPELEIDTEAVRLAQDVLCPSAVVPEPRLRRDCVELGQALLLAWEVKDAPRSTGSAPAGRGRARRPLVALDPEVLQQDRTELDQPKGGLAPDDDGVHAGTVAVVGADAAVAVAVQRSGVAAIAAITFTGDQVDEGRFLSLLHESLT